MQTAKSVLWITIGAAALTAVGCDLVVGGRERDNRVYVADRPQYVQQQQPIYVEQEPQYVIVQEAPPPVRVERRPSPPSSASIWIDGYWNWDNQRYSWQAGRYESPPQANVVWIAPSYVRDVKGYRYTPGRWGNQNPGNGNGNGNGRGRGRGN